MNSRVINSRWHSVYDGRARALLHTLYFICVHLLFLQSLIKYVKATEDAKTQVENEADKTNALQRINTQSEEIVVKSGCQKVKRKKKKGKTKKVGYVSSW